MRSSRTMDMHGDSRFRYGQPMRPLPRRSPIKGALLLALALVCVCAAYLYGNGTLSAFVTDNIIAPVQRVFAQNGSAASGSKAISESASAPKSDAQSGGSVVHTNENVSKETVSIGEQTVYALQAGVFADRKNAINYAESVRKLGGGGFITEDGGKYRVLLSLYYSEADAETVRKRLADENALSAAVFAFTRAPLKLGVTASAADMALIRDATAYAPKLLETLYSASAKLDGGTLASGALADALSEPLARCVALRDGLEPLAPCAEELVELQGFYVAVAELLSSLSKTDPTTQAPAELKYALLAAWQQWSGCFTESA